MREKKEYDELLKEAQKEKQINEHLYNARNKKRELQSKLLLSLEAANRGHEVYLGRMMENLKKGEFYQD